MEDDKDSTPFNSRENHMAIGQDNMDLDRGSKYTLYDFSERAADSKYPSWVDGAPNLQSYLNAINKSQPIIQCQYELVWSRWPRTMFFAKGITIPGISVNTVDLNHAGFTIKIPTHVTYETTDITLNLIADKEGFHYYDLRNMVMQTGHPLVAGDPKSTIGNPYGLSSDEDTIEVRLRNKPSDETHHHWIIHNFKPIGIGDIELSQDSGSFVEFELKGTFTHITYDCGNGQGGMPQQAPEASENASQEANRSSNNESMQMRGEIEEDNEVEVEGEGDDVESGDVLKTTQLTLPQRFGMYKTPTKDVPKTTQIELDDPPFNPSPRQLDPNHKVRGIFD